MGSAAFLSTTTDKNNKGPLNLKKVWFAKIWEVKESHITLTS
jgi:hypothetical protein